MASPSVQRDSPRERLATPIQFLKGVGPHRADLLNKLGLRTARDLLFYFPRDYQDLSELKTIDQLVDGELASVEGRVEELDQRNTSSGGVVLGVLVRQGHRGLRLLYFNQPYMRDRFQPGQRVLAAGKVRMRGMVWEMAHPRVEWLEDEDQPAVGKMLPVYSLCEGLNQGQLRRIVAGVVEEFAELLDEVFPEEFLSANSLWPIHQALPQLHFPENRGSLEQARRRFVYQELFILQLALALRKQRQLAATAPVLEATARIDARIRRLFPYELTPGQSEAIREVSADMGRAVPMNRLLQGDVGSGKTAVAVYAMLVAVAHGCQAVLMAPTEILARQHVRTLEVVLAASRVRHGLLAGGMPLAERRELLAKAASGEIDVLIGTHAILEPDVRFNKLGLAVIDEQQKFGVRDRARLKRAGLDPHYLVMTATPIPRTVALSLYGDLDVSIIRDAPPGRQKVHSYLATPEQRPRWWDFFRRKLREGRQGYVVVPLVESSDQIDAANLAETLADLSRGELRGFRLGQVHGRMPPGEKEQQVAAFRQGETQVLVSTTVIEVGVDVPNATMLTIEGGERFGLAQLHQLRGRVSRGTHPGFCCVFADIKNEQSQQRLDAFVSTTDGFKLAEIDFEQRGPG
ncbi:MAG: ATP-dependent DNA helicase RecG, partial [Pirellulales bacterium]